jgi:hypothetical protein
MVAWRLEATLGADEESEAAVTPARTTESARTRTANFMIFISREQQVKKEGRN